jgi:alkylhydroperoxidase family enzyme
MYIKTIDPSDATGEIARMYEGDIQSMGMVMNATSCWSALPEAGPVAEHLLHTARGNFSLGLKAWRLIVLIVAKHVPSTYCTQVYSKILQARHGLTRQEVAEIQRDFRTAPALTPAEVAMLAYAEQIAIDASRIGPADIAALRAAGFSDRNIADIAFCAAHRAFVSRYFDAVGATPEAEFLDPDPEFRAQMTVGKPLG